MIESSIGIAVIEFPEIGLRIALPTARKTVGWVRPEYVPGKRLGDEHYKGYGIRKHRNLIA